MKKSQRKNRPKRKHNKNNKNGNQKQSVVFNDEMEREFDFDTFLLQNHGHNSCSSINSYDTALLRYTCVQDSDLQQRIDSLILLITSFIEDEINVHGRRVCCRLLHVPGTWYASLGGSRMSLLAEVVGIQSRKRKIAKIRDIDGHQTLVRFHPEAQAVTVAYPLPYPFNHEVLYFQEPLFKCFLPGHFILIKGVSWQQTSKDSLEIFVKSPKDVVFFPPELAI